MKQGLVSILLTKYKCGHKTDGVIILDDNSEPETLAVLYEYINHPKVVFYKSNVSPEDRWKRPGYIVNINIGLKIAQGEFICYLPDDDLLLPNAFELLTGYLNENPVIVVAYGEQKITRNGEDAGNREGGRIVEWAPAVIDHGQVMHRSSILQQTGDWPTFDMRCGDASFWTSLHKAGCKFYPINELTCIHRYHTNELSSKMDRGELNLEPRE